MKRLTVRAKYLYEGDQKFFARGVSYGTFAPNSKGEGYPEPERVDADFALMHALGANLVRVYEQPPPWMFELARKHEVRLMIGIAWPYHLAFLDSAQMTRDIRKTVADSVASTRQFSDVILAYSLGNEIRSDIVRWHGPRAINRFLREVYDSGKQLNPDTLFTFCNYPSTEYLDLNFFDFVSFNVYLHQEADFRRYLTHLLATTYDRPLILSETGMDTIREGEAHQAQLLRWQGRATFELGLSGFIVFAFTDEWYRGGADITDWAFGLVTRSREPKPSFSAIAGVFNSRLPPPLELPQASVVVCAYNAAETLPACLTSLARLNYPNYEVIVIDDGSTDQTSQIATDAAVRVVRTDHCGLSAARNRGVAEAHGRIIAFLDADAEADSDWLYHLAETLERTGAIAVGGQNFPPEPKSTLQAALAAAPGAPREVPAGDDSLDQVCGCSMALDKSRLPDPVPFDEMFMTAGDDVDFSWTMHERGFRLAYAPGAAVIHHRRPTFGAYLRQQAGYGRGEAILARKYPDRMSRGSRVYGDEGWVARWFGGGPKIYYGAFGRGLFQSLYRDDAVPLLSELLLQPQWLIVAIALCVAGAFGNRLLEPAGVLAVVATLAAAVVTAGQRQVRGKHGSAAIVPLAVACLLGPWWRSSAANLDQSQSLLIDDDQRRGYRRFQRHGEIPLTGSGTPAAREAVEFLSAGLRSRLLRRRATVAVTDNYQPYDLQIRSKYGVVGNLNLLNQAGHIVLGWKLGLSMRRFLMSLFAWAIPLAVASLVLLPLVGRWAWIGLTAAALFWIFWNVVEDLRRLPIVIELAARDVVGDSTAAVTSEARGIG
jgi:glycosyltransferase involved in cell wall biosynthesis